MAVELAILSVLTSSCVIFNNISSVSATFPDGFIFSSASSAYQSEGAWNIDGKGESIWDRLTHTRPQLIINQSNGDVTCNSYYLYKEDVKLMKYIGFQMYRFSISWTRILPNGDTSVVNQKGIKHYHRVINLLLKNGIQPMVTIYHWDLPQKLQDLGGWRNASIIKYMADYANILFKEYGKKVKWWLTINEPVSIVFGYATTQRAPALNFGFSNSYIVGHNILKAHAAAYQLYDTRYRAKQKGKISLTISGITTLPRTNSIGDFEATERTWQFLVGWFAHPIFSQPGDYPPLMRKIIDAESVAEGRARSRLPRFTAEEINCIRGSADFFALNHYITVLCSPNSTDPLFGWRDLSVQFTFNQSWPSTCNPYFKVVPWGIREVLRQIKIRYNNPPVFITENGVCDSPGHLNDVGRIQYYQGYLNETTTAINTYGCKVIGYTVWSISDDFEWTAGYASPFGITYVDFEDPQRKRTLKLSAVYFKWFIQNKRNPNIFN